jgi:hypothetical protein
VTSLRQEHQNSYQSYRSNRTSGNVSLHFIYVISIELIHAFQTRPFCTEASKHRTICIIITELTIDVLEGCSELFEVCIGVHYLISSSNTACKQISESYMK